MSEQPHENAPARTDSRTGSRRAVPAARSGASGRPRPPLTVILAVAVPLVAVLAGLLSSGAPATPPQAQAPADAPLSSLQLVCPAAASGGGSAVLAATTGTGGGQVALRVGDGSTPLALKPGTSASAASPRATVVDGRDALAPGLLAARFDSTRRAGYSCGAPRADYWFTGVGAGSLHSSRLQLVNPDGGPAVADITAYGPDGPVDVPDVRGITVSGRTAESIDLSKTIPTRDTLALHVAVVRGRLGVSVLDRVRDDRTMVDWLPAQAEPATTAVLPGMAPGAGPRTLVVLNPSPDEALVDVQLVGPDSTFTPTGIEGFSVPPESVVTREIGPALAPELGNGVTGIRLSSSTPIAASLASLAGDDLAHAVATAPLTRTAALVPDDARASLVLAAPTGTGSVTVVARSAGGKVLTDRRVEIKAQTGLPVALPAKTALVEVRVESGTGLVGALRLQLDGGLVTLPLQDLVDTSLVPAVRPALG